MRECKTHLIDRKPHQQDWDDPLEKNIRRPSI